jgi:acetyl-CoA C-acetyltransferase
MRHEDPVVIVSAARTPLGGFQGALSSLAAPTLGAAALRATLARASLDAAKVDEVFMGCVLPAGLGQAPARQAALAAGLTVATPCTTVSKVCGSGMKAVMLAHDAIACGSAQVVLAGGMESMSNAPYLLPKARGGMRLGHGQVLDHMFLDGLEDAYAPDTRGQLMGQFAEACASEFGFTREAQDAYAIASTTRAQDAIRQGAMNWEIAPVQEFVRGKALTLDQDEQPLKAQVDKIATLKPAFRPDGTVTAANASSISDGAAALMMMRTSTASSLGLSPLARVVGHSSHAQEPPRFTTAPAGAVRKLLSQVSWQTSDVDLWEVNEAFAVVAMAAMQELGLAHKQVNVHGGACALGHPIGATGARLIVTLLGALRHRGLRRGVATLCIGGGEATAVAIEMI